LILKCENCNDFALNSVGEYIWLNMSKHILVPMLDILEIYIKTIPLFEGTIEIDYNQYIFSALFWRTLNVFVACVAILCTKVIWLNNGRIALHWYYNSSNRCNMDMFEMVRHYSIGSSRIGNTIHSLSTKCHFKNYNFFITSCIYQVYMLN
jgi:hypothetical protein